MTLFIGSYFPTSKVNVLSPAGLLIDEVDIQSGTVRWASGSYPTVTGSFRVSDVDEGPLSSRDKLSPATGNRLRVWNGSVTETGVERIKIVADLVLTDCTESKPEGMLELQASSHEVRLMGDEFTRPHKLYSATRSAVEEVEELVRRTLPDMQFDWGGVDDVTLDKSTTWDGDAWACVETCLDALAAQAYFNDSASMLIVRPAADGGSENRGTITEGTEVVGLRNTYARYPNVAVMRGIDADGNQIVASASSTGVMDPTGDYGRVVVVEQAPADVTTQGDLQAAANALLRRTARRCRTVTVDVMGGYDFRPGDRVALDYLSGGTEPFTVRSVSLPLGPGQPTQIELGSLVVWQ